ncbi:unnamed protein product [Cylindrotheca closterium]|uniref:CCHC-type domain-containing protein n=1 Tax=Cylindrotheca closterium TaxID=2856 RepID=A0AAD2FFB0_9STRA|nr:unnamed protein product [Cylindrotheca closterium]
MLASESKRMYIPTFNREESEFQMWWMQFKAYATIAGFAIAIQRTRDPDLPPKDDEVLADDADGKKMKKSRDANSLAMATLTMAFTSASMMGMIADAVMADWLSGLAYKVIDTLLKRYRPSDVMSKVKMRREMDRVNMKKDDDPNRLFEQISQIENKYVTQKLSLEDLLAIVLDAAPIEYGATITAETRNKGNALTLEDIREAMHAQWRIMYPAAKTKKTFTAKEVELSSVDNAEVICYRCRKRGHMAFQCTEGRERERNNGTCNMCGKVGHIAVNCWQDERNAHKAPEWFKKKIQDEKKDGGNGEETGHTNIELLLCSIETDKLIKGDPQGMLSCHEIFELLNDPNIWIADTGASVDTTPYLDKLENVVKFEDGRGARTLMEGLQA